jgi:1-acyl-sn-glycerol-3-phosphate acyltransferase
VTDPNVRWERVSSVLIAVLVCLATPTIAVLNHDVNGSEQVRRDPLIGLVVGAVVGMILPFLYWSPYRSLGLIGYASTIWLATAIYGVVTGHWPGWCHGLLLGIIIGAITRGRRGPEPMVDTYILVTSVLGGAGIAWGFIHYGRPFTSAGFFVLGVVASVLVTAWMRLFRPTFEIGMEPLVWLLYKISGRGSGLKDFPRTGACIVLANHACWLDPLFLAKVIPRPITPMMTSRFYNLPVLRRLMIVFGVIQVSEKAIKKETPEIQQAIDALDRGECLVIFPEGYLRRTEEQPLRRFGQGIWQVLQARPNTPLFACWIEGGWGSYTSYWNGAPTKNKKLDFRRRVVLGVLPATIIPAEVLTDHMQTRYNLMNLVSAARLELGLAPLPTFELPLKSVNSEDVG